MVDGLGAGIEQEAIPSPPSNQNGSRGGKW